MSSEMSSEAMQNKIATARRDAEGLKDKIKRKKEELADTSCKSSVLARNLYFISMYRSACARSIMDSFIQLTYLSFQCEAWPKATQNSYQRSA